MSLPSGTKNRLQKEVWGGFGLAKKKVEEGGGGGVGVELLLAAAAF